MSTKRKPTICNGEQPSRIQQRNTRTHWDPIAPGLDLHQNSSPTTKTNPLEADSAPEKAWEVTRHLSQDRHAICQKDILENDIPTPSQREYPLWHVPPPYLPSAMPYSPLHASGRSKSQDQELQDTVQRTSRLPDFREPSSSSPPVGPHVLPNHVLYLPLNNLNPPANQRTRFDRLHLDHPNHELLHPSQLTRQHPHILHPRHGPAELPYYDSRCIA